MRDRDVKMYARVLLQMERARTIAPDQPTRDELTRLIGNPPYNDAQVRAAADQMLRTRQAVTKTPTVLDRVRGHV